MDHRRTIGSTHSRANRIRMCHSLYFCLLIVGAYVLTQVDAQESSEHSANATAKKSKDVCQVSNSADANFYQFIP